MNLVYGGLIFDAVGSGEKMKLETFADAIFKVYDKWGRFGFKNSNSKPNGAENLVAGFGLHSSVDILRYLYNFKPFEA